eukprot:TRINITY_DN35782_c0_g1_i2.p1 TRINITY_DN35782_c0_g1~~TRINITY_DN35782_c0_g1_i2.p1  ORF type:complete len:159 (+),score=35.71 TRINITY_DN35782_c0_g1_i2:50-478(+)
MAGCKRPPRIRRLLISACTVFALVGLRRNTLTTPRARESVFVGVRPLARAKAVFRHASASRRRLQASSGTLDKVANVVAEQLGLDTETVTRTAVLKKLGADALDIVETMMILEETFEVELSEKEVRKLKTVGDVADLIQSKL